MPRVMLFTMNACDTCEEMKQRLAGREDVDIVDLDNEPEKAKQILQEIKRQGDVHFEDVPQCVLKDGRGKYHLCDTENIEQVIDEVEQQR